MKKFVKLFLCFALCITGGLFLVSCGSSSNKNQESKTYESSNTGSSSSSTSPKTYTVSFDYGQAIDFFDSSTTIQSKSVNDGGNLQTLPTIKSQYSSSFLGWFIQDTDQQIDSSTSINSNLIVEARFNIETIDVSGLYQNGKYVKTWQQIRTEYSSAFKEMSSGIFIDFVGSTSPFYSLVGELIIDEEVVNITLNAFRGCTGLRAVIIQSRLGGLAAIYDYTFRDCTSLKMIKIPHNVTQIGYGAFYNCSSLEKIIEFGSDITQIAPYCFYGCESLKSFTIPQYVTQIGHAAFEGCSSLEMVQFMGSGDNDDAVLETIGQSAFQNCSSLKHITIPNSASEIGESAFAGCSSLTGVDLPSELLDIKDYTFAGCSSLISILIPNKVETIGVEGFRDCSSLMMIKIPASVTEIKTQAFWRCNSLINITIDSSEISNGLTNKLACGRILETVPYVVFIKSDLDTSSSTYLTDNYHTETSDKDGYIKWIKNS